MIRQATLGIVLLAATAGADGHEPLAPDRVQEVIEHELRDQNIDGVAVTVQGEDVTLSGQVDSALAEE